MPAKKAKLSAAASFIEEANSNSACENVHVEYENQCNNFIPFSPY
jgi:hypothetical protein